MPVIHENARAIRVIKGNVYGTQATDAFGNMTNREFVRVYKGNELKFDKIAENWLCIVNETSTEGVIAFKKYGTSWTNDVVIKWINSSALTTENTMTLDDATEYTATTAGNTNVITLPANGRVYIKNGNTSQNYFSENSANYLTIYVSQTFHVTGNWLELIPKSRLSNSIHPWAFYKLFESCTTLKYVPDLTRTSNGHELYIAQHAFDRMFYGCTGLTRSPAIYGVLPGGYAWYYDESSYGYGGHFSSMFQGCTGITSCGDITLVIYEGIGSRTHVSETPVESDGSMYNMFYGCTGIVTGPKFEFIGSAGRVADRCFYQTFMGCTNMTSIGGLVLGDVSGLLHLDDYSMYATFSGCSKFTGTGLSIRSRTMTDHEITTSYNETVVTVTNHSLDHAFYNCSKMTKFFGRSFSGSSTSGKSYLNFAVTASPSTSQTYGGNYAYMLYGCAYLTDDSMRWTYFGGAYDTKDWSNREFDNAFRGCTRITDASGLFSCREVNLDGQTNEYGEMVGVKILPAETSSSSQYCFNHAFYGCTRLTKGTVPNSTTAATYMYQYMYSGCTNIVTVTGKTAANTLGYMCRYMFQNCTSLVSGPVIGASSISGTQPYYCMFYNCSSLKYIASYFTAFSSSNNRPVNWTYGTTDGTAEVPRYYIALSEGSNFTSSDYNASGNKTSGNAYRIPYGWTIVNSPLCFIAEDVTRIQLTKTGNPAGTHEFTILNLSSSNPANTIYTPGTSGLITVSAGKMCLMWGTSTTGSLSSSNEDYYQFSVSGECYVMGSLTSLHKLNGNMGAGHDWCYYRLFRDCTGIIEASRLVGMSKTTSCNSAWREMLYGCTKLLYAPAPKQTTSANAEYAFREMLANCTSLCLPPSLSGCTAAAKGIFYGIFSGCTLLAETATLPASSSAMTEEKFDSMYDGCSSLKTVPSGYLPWTTLAKNCYHKMFANCSALESVPFDLLPATNLSNCDDCYNGMFMNDTELEKAPELMATTIGSGRPYGAIFYGCSKMNYIKVGFAAWSNAWGTTTYRNTQNWTYGLPASGHFYGPEGITTRTVYKNNSGNTGNSVSGSGSTDTSACYIPYNWTLHNTTTPPEPTDPWDGDNMLIFSYYVDDVTIRMGNNTNGMLYTTDAGSSWHAMNSSTALTINSGLKKIGFKSTSITERPGYYNDKTIFEFSGTGKVDVTGNVTSVTRVPGNPTHSDASFMFYGCRHIHDCTGIFFSSTVIRCRAMFGGSTVWKVNRNLLRDHTTGNYLDSNFYAMFKDCTDLVVGLNLFCDSPARYCDYEEIYRNCTSLQSTVSSNPITIAGALDAGPEYGFGAYWSFAFRNAFTGCTSIEAIYINMDYLGKTPGNVKLLSTFESCFEDCTNLRRVYSKHKRWPVLSCCKNWLKNTAASGTRKFYKYTGSGLVTERGVSRIPYGWDIEETTW